jgi:periplasmic divalent cation tolerance protein
MKAASQFCLALVTAPNRKVARRLAKCALKAQAAACANLVPGLESHYWWRGRLESSAEFLVLFKTTRKRARDLEKLIVKNHPYDTPEFIILRLTGGNKRYLRWLAESMHE